MDAQHEPIPTAEATHKPALASAAHIQRYAGWILWTLLAGYLIFNRPFALIGIPPLYVGEITIALCVAVLAPNFRKAFIEPIRDSWSFRLIAIFGLLCVGRALFDAKAHGVFALRDCIIGGYAVVAFIAPQLWKTHETLENKSDRSLQTVAKIIHYVSIPAACWALAFWAGLINLSIAPTTKMDFVAMSVLIACWLRLIHAMIHRPPKHSSVSSARFALLIAHTLLMLAVVFLFQNRTMWLGLNVLGAVLAAAFAYTPQRKKILIIGAIAAGIVFGFASAKLGKSFQRLEREFALDRELDFSFTQIEQSPEKVPIAKPNDAPKIQSSTPHAASPSSPRLERLFSIFTPDDSQFQTTEGRIGADAVRWRAMFWLRCVNYTLHQSPLFGIGFGSNLTLLLRNTPAWMYYVDSQNYDPPNRSPHCAHITIFTRTGILGLIVWLGILGITLWSGLKFCWQMRAEMSRATNFADRESLRLNFWAMLAILGVWLVYLWAMTFGVVLENPFGGIWFWVLTGVVLSSSRRCARINSAS